MAVLLPAGPNAPCRSAASGCNYTLCLIGGSKASFSSVKFKMKKISWPKTLWSILLYTSSIQTAFRRITSWRWECWSRVSGLQVYQVKGGHGCTLTPTVSLPFFDQLISEWSNMTLDGIRITAWRMELCVLESCWWWSCTAVTGRRPEHRCRGRVRLIRLLSD